MDQPFAHTLSFDDLEVLVLVENGGATPREVADSLGMELEETKALFTTLCGAVCSLARRNPPPSSSPPWPPTQPRPGSDMCSDCSCGQPTPAPSPVVAPRARRTLELHHNLLHRNDTLAAANRERFAAAGLLVLNVLSAPGSGKTALLERVARQWNSGPVGVIVGDLATDNDALRLRAAGARAVQIQTGDLCHLEASLVGRAFDQLDAAGMELLLIENVGNLVCPTAFDLGERLRLALLSVTEGEDKPLKYPALFKSADAVVINKVDIAAAVGFDRAAALANLAAVAPQARIFELSARTGEGLDALLHWLSHHRQPEPQPKPQPVPTPA